jgi:Kef-type K+ transport system membrane component KefB
VLALIDPESHVLASFAELGVLVLLFEIGLESNLGDLLKVGPQSLLVAAAGMIFPFLLGWLVMFLLGSPSVTAIFIGATLTATSIGITARVLADMGKIGSVEGRIIIGAAVVDDILGLVVLAVVKNMATEGKVSLIGVAKATILAIVFFAGALVVGRLAARPLLKIVSVMKVRGVLLVFSVSFAFILAIFADLLGSATLVGAFAAGLVLAQTYRKQRIQENVTPLADFFVPIFFAFVGAAVDVRFFNPFDPDRRRILGMAALLLIAAILGKLVSGFFAVKKGQALRRSAVGVGMIPRGEVGLVFAGIGLTTGAVASDTYAAIVVVVILTTFLAPPLLRLTMK